MSYTYNLTVNDTLNNKVDAAKLELEINEQLFSQNITEPRIYVDMTDPSLNGSLQITFENQLTTPEEMALNTCIENHDGISIPPPPTPDFTATEPGQLLMSIDGVTITKITPLMNGEGWLVNDNGEHIIKG